MMRATVENDRSEVRKRNGASDAPFSISSLSPILKSPVFVSAF